ncbi:Hypothetical predicted protein [Cloeon dipterum]|uniref:Uncharacterized protein n=1 Tax=Cloeon dipterum TaxID=197152 RepID=A0A8S1CH36_9INSE|nr:Hypothetical predicted protein [Cloeon dipterum]
MMRFCAFALLIATATADKPEWSQPIKQVDRTDWVPVIKPRDLEVAAQEDVPTILRPPAEQPFLFRQGPRQIRNEFGFPREQQNPFRFPGQPSVGPPPRFQPAFRTAAPPPFLQQGPPQQFQFANQQPQLPPQQQPQVAPVKQQNQTAPQEEVQLVYVPVDALPPFQGQSNVVPVQQLAPQDVINQFNRSPSPFGNQQQLFNQEQQRIAVQRDQEERKKIQEEDLKRREAQEKRIRQEVEQKKIQQQKKPISNLREQENLFQQRFPQPSELPKNQPAPHQPPLAVYLTGGKPESTTKLTVSDVLETLKDATTIPVLDQLPDTQDPPPHIFVGPAEMSPPEGYAKFELPYLNSLETNRVERKVEQFPFFVAPLSYNPPQGYNKIPFPSPHIGSVVFGPSGRAIHSQPIPQQIPQFENNEEQGINPAIPLLVNSLQSERNRPSFQPQSVTHQFNPPQAQTQAPFNPPQAQSTFNPPQAQTQAPFNPTQFQATQAPFNPTQFQAPQAPVHRPQPIPSFTQPQRQQQRRPVTQQPQFIYQDEQAFGPPQPQQQVFPPQQQVFQPQQPAFAPPPPQQQNFPRQHHNRQHHRPQQHVEQFIHQKVTPAQHVQPQTFFEQETIPQTQPPRSHFVHNHFQFNEEPVVTEPQIINEIVTEPVTEPPTTTTTTTTTEAPTTRQVTRPRNQHRGTPAPAVREENVERRPVNRGRRPVPRQRTTTPEPEVVVQEDVEVPELQRTNVENFVQTEAPNYPQPTQISSFNDFQNFAQIPSRQQHLDVRPQFPSFQFENAFHTQPAVIPQSGVTYADNSATINLKPVYPEEPVVEASPSPLNYPTASPSPHAPVRQFSATPFAPTAVPEYYTQSTTAAPEVVSETEASVVEVASETPTVVEPQRTRQRVPVAANDVANNAPARPRGRVRQRVRVNTAEEGETDNVRQSNPQRTRSRTVVRTRTTTTEAEPESATENTRRYQPERTRVRARPQVVRSRNQEDIELNKPVRQGVTAERVTNESPVYVPEQVEQETEKQEPAATEPPRRFKNFGVGQRRRVVRPVPANQAETESEKTIPARNTAVRNSRRQQVATGERPTVGRLLQKSVRNEEHRLETGVTYSKSLEAETARDNVEEVKEEVEEAPAPPRKRVSANRPRQNYPEGYEVDEDQPASVYRPRLRAGHRNNFYESEDPEFKVEESQRSEQISVQQLGDLVPKEFYQSKYSEGETNEEEVVTEEVTTDVATTDEVPQQEEVVASTDAVPTVFAEESSDEVETEKPKFSAKIKVNNVKRRIRLKKRPLTADVFETAESQNIASANLNNAKSSDKAEESNAKLSNLDVKETITTSHQTLDVESIHITSTTTTSTTTEAPVVTTPEEPVTSEISAESTSLEPEDFTTQESTTVPDEEVATTAAPNRIIGTSTTTEISLETEICYKGRCVKTKGDMDQLPFSIE